MNLAEILKNYAKLKGAFFPKSGWATVARSKSLHFVASAWSSGHVAKSASTMRDRDGVCSNNPRYCSTGCQPKNSWKETSCFPTPYCANLNENFTSPRIANIHTFDGNPTTFDFVSDYNAEGVVVEDSKLSLIMKLDRVPNSFGRPQGLSSVVSTTRFMQYGKVKARIKTGSSSPGVVSAFIIRNEEPGDEIDFEIVGKNPTEAQTNFYYRTPPDMAAELIDYSNTGKASMGVDSTADFHEYGIEWTPDHIHWTIDGRIIRSVFRNQTADDALDPNPVDPATGQKRKRFPSTPARIQFGIWDGGQGSNGTAAWAGSPTNWSPPNIAYTIQVDSVQVECYYQGNDTLVWPPPGYGPTKSYQKPYSTPGSGGDNQNYNEQGGGHEGEEFRPFVPFYKNKMLMIPTGIVLGLAVFAVTTMEVLRRRRLAKVRWS
ncbi:hypothetical protein DFQ27_007069 [Actinomortierella ambigua]|uniref:GH16 domain-containing protein n=1 Tax=Actinomortierella ambigua TaxID=1343610 RepID=A0A9P6PXC0_9FUNG|nr:hypothetical protein DFQ27_007069 [Actinomortierella ambigua]